MKEANPEFCTGVQILLSRMESNPEEFGRNSDKWGRMLEQLVMWKELGSERMPSPNYLTGLTAAEKNALYDAYQKFLRKSFDDWVMKEILTDAEEELSYSVASAPNVVLGNSGAGSSGITLSAGAGQPTWTSTPFISATPSSRSITIGEVNITEQDLALIKRRVGL